MNIFKIAVIGGAIMCAQVALADWSYDASTDTMTGKSTKTASITSTNSLSLPFPHSGINHARLIVRQHPKHGLDVIFSLDKGQILCSNYSGCPIAIKFDDAQPVTFEGSETADRDTTMVFIQNPKKFIAAASKAKKILVQVTLYKNGSPITNFESSKPLDWISKK